MSPPKWLTNREHFAWAMTEGHHCKKGWNQGPEGKWVID